VSVGVGGSEGYVRVGVGKAWFDSGLYSMGCILICT
jgi:hypothetical protein